MSKDVGSLGTDNPSRLSLAQPGRATVLLDGQSSPVPTSSTQIRFPVFLNLRSGRRAAREIHEKFDNAPPSRE